MADSIASAASTDAFIFISGFIGIFFAIFQYKQVARISLTDAPGGGNQAPLVTTLGIDTSKLVGIYEAIREGADSFLRAEYTICAYFLAGFGVVVLLLVSYTGGEFHIDEGGLTAIAFLAGGVTSIVSGLIGMKVAVFANARTTVMAAGSNAWTDAFNTAFQAGSVMGFALCGLSMLVLYIFAHLYTLHFKNWDEPTSSDALHLFECLAGYGLGGSSVALFGRVGGGIYTKAADVGADLAGKVVEDIPRTTRATPPPSPITSVTTSAMSPAWDPISSAPSPRPPAPRSSSPPTLPPSSLQVAGPASCSPSPSPPQAFSSASSAPSWPLTSRP